LSLDSFDPHQKQCSSFAQGNKLTGLPSCTVVLSLHESWLFSTWN
jgi:hypothetical protein